MSGISSLISSLSEELHTAESFLPSLSACLIIACFLVLASVVCLKHLMAHVSFVETKWH